MGQTKLERDTIRAFNLFGDYTRDELNAELDSVRSLMEKMSGDQNFIPEAASMARTIYLMELVLKFQSESTKGGVM